jgi:hypothetical protein
MLLAGCPLRAALARPSWAAPRAVATALERTGRPAAARAAGAAPRAPPGAPPPPAAPPPRAAPPPPRAMATATAKASQGELARQCLVRAPAPIVDIGVNLADDAFEKVRARRPSAAGRRRRRRRRRQWMGAPLAPRRRGRARGGGRCGHNSKSCVPACQRPHPPWTP